MNNLYEKILAAREQRFVKIDFLKNRFKTVITVKTNFPGSNKNHNLSYILTDYFVDKIPEDFISSKEFFDGKDGPYYLIGSHLDSNQIKNVLMVIEDNHPLGRLIDFDVFDGMKTLSRMKFRKCYVCDDFATKCIIDKKHSVEVLVDYMNSEALNHFKNEIIELVDSSILLELNLDPKFGLVTPLTNGSHNDMNYKLMLNAKNTILPYFGMMFEEGWTTRDLDLVFRKIRQIGLKAEASMFDSTSGVNAYKGLIFGMGILVTAYSYILYNHLHISKIFNIVEQLSMNLLEDFNIESSTFGYYAHKEYSMQGARGEFYKGIPNVKKALEYLVDFKDESRLRTLMFLISKVEDTSFLKRANNYELYTETKKTFSQKLYSDKETIKTLSDYCIDKNLTFGGSADLLIITIFLKKIMR